MDEFAFPQGQRVVVQLSPRVDSPAILKVLEAVQPFTRMDGAVSDARQMPLWAINELCNIDKHRLLLVVACALKIDDIWWSVSPDDPSPKVRVNPRALVDGDPVAWFEFEGQEMPTRFDPHLKLSVALREDDVPRYWHDDVLRTLGQFLWFVEDWIVNWQFRPLFTGLPPNPVE